MPAHYVVPMMSTGDALCCMIDQKSLSWQLFELDHKKRCWWQRMNVRFEI